VVLHTVKSRRALALVCALAALCLAPAGARAASPLAWSAPVLIETHGPFGATNEVESMACASSSLCVAGSDHGKVVTTTDPADGGSATWTVTGANSPSSIVRMSCPSASLCVGVDEAGNAITSTDPADGGAAVWGVQNIDGTTPMQDELHALSCPSTTLCVAGDEVGNILTTTDPADGTTATWTTKAVDSSGFFISGLSCPSASLCVGVDREGDVLTSTDPADGAGATWTVTNLFDPTATSDRFNDVSCIPGSTLCVAVTQKGLTFTSSDPGDGATATWTSLDIDGTTGITAISCTSAPLCVAVDNKRNALESTDPADAGTATWTTQAGIEPGGPFAFFFPIAVSCVGSSLCVVGDIAGRTVTSTNPAGGAGVTWAVKSGVVGVNQVRGSSCPSATLCVAVDQAGNTFTSADPGDGANASWAFKADIDAPAHNLTSISCPSTSLCVAVDNAGNALESSDPADGATATWTLQNIDGTKIIESVSCASTSLCVATDDAGSVFTSTNPTAGAGTVWSSQNADGQGDVRGVSCIASPELCVAVDDTGNVLTSTNPDLGAGATWATLSVDGSATLNGVSCIASPVSCSAVDGQGNVLSTGDPQDGASASWGTTAADPGLALNAITCPSAGLCLVADAAGNAVTSTNPTAPGPTWVVAHDIDPGNSIGTVACASPELCVAGDAEGNIQSGIGHSLTVTLAGDGQGSVSSSPAGVACPGTCASSYATGTQVTLTATPAGTSTFVGWSGGGCSGTGTCKVTLDADQDVTAQFAGSRTLSVTAAGAGQGTVKSDPAGISCPGTCASPFTTGASVTLTATPSAGSTFTGWSGGGCSGTDPCTVDMSSDQAVTATFGLAPHTLTVSTAGSGAGKVTSNPAAITCPGTCAAQFSSGATVTLTATANSGSTFTGWSGAGCSGTGNCVVTMTADQAVKATFVPVQPPPTTTTTTTPPPPRPPSCTLKTSGTRVLVGSSVRHGRRTPAHASALRTLHLVATCDQSARLTLVGKLTSALKRGHEKRHFTVRAGATANPGQPLKLTVKLPAAALKPGARDSISFTLHASGAGGSGTATAKIRKLKLVSG
jgi:hypothetical protein